MSVVSEDAIRKIVRNSLLEEGLFKKARSDSGEGSVRYLSCDLKNLKNSSVAAKFIKYFLLKPEFSKVVSGEKKYFTKNMLMLMLEGGLDDPQDAEYERLVSDYVRSHPEIIDRWISALEFSITQVFGPLSSMYCNLFSNLFLTGTYTPPKDKEIPLEDISENIAGAFRRAGEKFSLEEELTIFKDDFEPEHLILFPNTFIAVQKGEDRDDVEEIFRKEKDRLNDMLRGSFRIKNLYRNFSDLFKNIRNKRSILSSINNVSSNVEDSDTNNDRLKRLVEKNMFDCMVILKQKHNLT